MLENKISSYVESLTENLGNNEQNFFVVAFLKENETSF